MLSVPKILAALVPLLVLTGAANVMTVQKTLELGLNEELRVAYSGTSRVYVLTSSLPQEIFITVVQAGERSGSVYVKVNRMFHGTYNYIVALYSESPYTVNISVSRLSGYVVESLSCPANVTLQLYLRLAVSTTYASPAPAISQIPMYLMPTTWSLVAMLAIPSLFITSALLDVRDNSRIKRDRWGTHESIALVMRYMLYGNFIAFIITLLVTVSLTVFSNLAYGVLAFNPSPIITSLAVLIATVLGYMVCKWRGWYDVVDEE